MREFLLIDIAYFYKNYRLMKLRLPSIIIAMILIGCSSEEKSENWLENQIIGVKSEFAPDKRVARFNVEAIKNNDKYILRGESNLPKAVKALKEQLSLENVAFIDSIKLLPSVKLNGMVHAAVNISVANMRSNAKHSAELVTQATLGTPINVLKKEDGWYYIQTPDNYLSWVDEGGIELMDDHQANTWKSAQKVIFTKTFGHTYSTPNHSLQVVSDIVAGSVLAKIDEDVSFFKVKFPDGRLAFVDRREAADYKQWLENLNPTTETLVSTSKRLMGVPYLWGGTSTKGVDCSGFTKTIFFLNGMVIPRDASQQVHTGKAIDSTMGFDKLIKGDLLFFGSKATDSTAEKVVHVGMWIGDNQFIHASEMVRISSVDPNASNFDEWNRNRYLRTKRILNVEDKELIDLTKTPVFKD